jgi:AcrR family transcriptional regulator
VIIAAVIAGLGALVALLFLPARPAAVRSIEELGENGDLVVRGAQDLPAGATGQRDVLGATLRILTEAGFSSLNFHGVAARAGIATGTIEKNWNSKLDLVIDALHEAFADYPIPDTGTLREDCCAYLRQTADGLATPGARSVIAGLVGDSVRDDELTESIRSKLVEPRLQALHTMVDRAIARGELDPDIDPAVLVDTLAGPLYHRLLITGEPIDQAAADAIVHLVLDGAIRREP